jgi:hypothetical protein
VVHFWALGGSLQKIAPVVGLGGGHGRALGLSYLFWRRLQAETGGSSDITSPLQ